MRSILLLPFMLLLWSSTGHAQSPISESTINRLLREDFFVFDNGAGRGLWSPEEQAETLARLGYAGIGYSGVEDLENRLAAFDRHNVKIFNLYVACDLNAEVSYGADLVSALARLKGTNVLIWLTVQGQSVNDAKAVRVVSEIADLAAASDLRVALYPHAGFFVADIGDALRIVRQVDKKNLGVTFNLCHELKAGNEAKFDTLLKDALPHLFVISINGTDHTGNWDTLIQPLGKGAFDVPGLLRKILALGYDGPVGLQCYNVPGDTLANLEHNIAEWKKMLAQLATAND